MSVTVRSGGAAADAGLAAVPAAARPGPAEAGRRAVNGFDALLLAVLLVIALPVVVC